MSATEWLTADEVAAEIRMSLTWVSTQCAKGSLRATKLGRTWRISRAALDDFMAGKPAPANPGPRRRRARA